MFLIAQSNLKKCIIILAMVALFESGPGFIFSFHYSKQYITKCTFPIMVGGKIMWFCLRSYLCRVLFNIFCALNSCV